MGGKEEGKRKEEEGAKTKGPEINQQKG